MSQAICHHSGDGLLPRSVVGCSLYPHFHQHLVYMFLFQTSIQCSSMALLISSPKSSLERSENTGLLQLDCASIRSNHVLWKGILASGGGGRADEAGEERTEI